MNTPHPADPQIAALHSAQAAHPRFAMTGCSQCGCDTGPGNSGFSHCADHRARDAQHAIFGTIARAVQPASVAQRFAFGPDYGSFNAHPADPRTAPGELFGDMLEQINCAERALAMARQALEGVGHKVSTVAARQQMNEARDFLAVPR